MKTRCGGIKSSSERVAVHRKERSNLTLGEITCDQRGSQNLSYLVGKRETISGLEYVNLFLQQLLQFIVGTGRANVEPIAREHQSIVLRIEIKRNLEELAEWFDIGGTAVAERSLNGSKIRAAESAHDVEHHRDRTGPGLIGRFEPRFKRVIRQHGHVFVDPQCHHGPLGVEMQQID